MATHIFVYKPLVQAFIEETKNLTENERGYRVLGDGTIRVLDFNARIKRLVHDNSALPFAERGVRCWWDDVGNKQVAFLRPVMLSGSEGPAAATGVHPSKVANESETDIGTKKAAPENSNAQPGKGNTPQSPEASQKVQYDGDDDSEETDAEYKDGGGYEDTMDFVKGAVLDEDDNLLTTARTSRYAKRFVGRQSETPTE